MKQVFVILTISLFATVTATANGGAHVPIKVKAVFEKQFTHNSSAQWKKVGDTFIASFKCNGDELEAYYDEDGIWLGTGRYIPRSFLPMATLESLSTQFENFHITRVFEFDSATEGTMYYITLDSPRKFLVIRATSTSISLERKINKH